MDILAQEAPRPVLRFGRLCAAGFGQVEGTGWREPTSEQLVRRVPRTQNIKNLKWTLRAAPGRRQHLGRE